MRIQQPWERLLRKARLSCGLKLVLQTVLLLFQDFPCYNFAEASKYAAPIESVLL